MKVLAKICFGVLLAVAINFNAQAVLITAGTTTALATGNETSTAAIRAIIQSAPYNVGSELYKQDYGSPLPADGGAFAGSYSTTFGSPSLLDEDFTITYGGGAFILSNPVYLLVKDGNHDPSWYLYDISGWNGTDVIEGQNFWPGPGGISHVAIYGTAGTSVPDAGSMVALLGLAVVGVDQLRRRIVNA